MRVKYTISEAFALGNLLLVRYPMHDHMTEIEIAVLVSWKIYFRRRFIDVVERGKAKHVNLFVGRAECLAVLRYLEFVEPDDPFEMAVYLDFKERMRKEV